MTDAKAQYDILLADDSDVNRSVAKSILEREGHTVFSVSNGLEVLAVTEQRRFDLIFLDILMPVMDGLRTLGRLRRRIDTLSDTPVFALTAFCEVDDQKRYFLAGFDAVIAKPLRPGDLARAMTQIGERKCPLISPNVELALATIKDVPLIDTRMTEQLCRADTQMLNRLMSNYWQDMRNELQHVQTSLPSALKGDSTELEKLRRSAHAIKGASQSIGLSRVGQIARRLQNAPPNLIKHWLVDLGECMNDSRVPLRDALGLMPSGATQPRGEYAQTG